MLPNPDFPLVFDSINGICQEEFGDTSYFNEMEVSAVINWIKKLTASNWDGKHISKGIGVVSPYKNQCSKIRNELINNGFDGITVGTAEVFQG